MPSSVQTLFVLKLFARAYSLLLGSGALSYGHALLFGKVYQNVQRLDFEARFRQCPRSLPKGLAQGPQFFIFAHFSHGRIIFSITSLSAGSHLTLFTSFISNQRASSCSRSEGWPLRMVQR